MSLLTDASLVLVPSAYKTGEVLVQKPLPTRFADETGNYDGNDPQGSANLTFTRTGDTATRVNADGLVEKVRTNLLLQSNQFDTTWVASGASVASGQTGYDGSSNAWLLTKNAAFGRLDQTRTASGVQVYSLYAKANDSDWIYFRADFSGGVASGYFDLANGLEGSFGNTIDSDITSVGNGWYRIQIVFNQTINVVRIYPAENNNQSGGTSGSIYIQNAQLEYGDIATDWIETTSAAVSVGPVANLPRIDYTGGGCGKLLLEPQRTNLALYSEQFDNAAWNKGTLNVTANAGTAPDGTASADLMYPSSNSSNSVLYNGITVSSGVEYTNSICVKASGKTWVFVRGINNANGVWFDLTNGVKGTTGSGVSGDITLVGSGWYRCSVTQTSTGTTGRLVVLVVDGNASTAVTANGTDGLLVWGAQIEAGSYATSYIPTLGAAVTRGADAAYKTGISSLIGQTEGALFAEVDLRSNSSTKRILYLSDGTTNNEIRITSNAASVGDIQYAVRLAGTLEVNYFTPTNVYTNGVFKIAAAYKGNDFVLYINGVQVGTDTSGGVPTCSRIDVGSQLGTSGFLDDRINQALVFKTRLTNAQLAELTTL